MEQEITLSKSIVSYIDNFFKSNCLPKDFSIPEFYKVINILYKNLVVIDKKKQYSGILLNELDKLKNDVRSQEFREAFAKFLVDRNSLIECRLNPDEKNYIFDLCNNSDDKIYFDPEITDDELTKTKLLLRFSEYGNIELHSLESFLNPNNDVHKFQVRNYFDFKKGKRYNLKDILKPYLRHSKCINFIDKYLPNELSLYHIKKILPECKDFRKIIFTTLTKKDYLLNIKPNKKIFAENNYREFEKLINGNKNFKFKKIYAKGHVDRYIITDKYKIKIPGGFDQFDKKGFPRIDSENKNMQLLITEKTAYL